MTYKPQSMTGKPDSVIKHEKFEDLMKRYHGQMESALYAAEMACPQPWRGICNDYPKCPFNNETVTGRFCGLISHRALLGDHVPQHDIQIPEDDTQAQRKRDRAKVE